MAYKLLCVLALVVAASAAPENRLLGGSPADARSAPYVVSIKYTYPVAGITIQRCAGALISSWHVVTTAFCFQGAIIQNLRVQAGSSNSMEGGVARAVTHYVKHPLFQVAPRTADIAVLFVAEYYAITPEVNVLYLPSATLNLDVGTELKVVGWGFDQPVGGTQLSELHSINMKTMRQDECKTRLDSDVVLIDDSSMCAVGDGVGVCQGDSGAPAVVSNVLAGVSSVTNCGSQADVFVRVPTFSSWILSVAVAPSSEGIPVRMV